MIVPLPSYVTHLVFSRRSLFHCFERIRKTKFFPSALCPRLFSLWLPLDTKTSTDSLTLVPSLRRYLKGISASKPMSLLSNKQSRYFFLACGDLSLNSIKSFGLRYVLISDGSRPGKRVHFFDVFCSRFSKFLNPASKLLEY